MHRKNIQRSWNLNKLKREKFLSVTDRETENNKTPAINDCMNMIKNACNMSMPRKVTNNRWKPTYWWSGDKATK